MRVGITGQNGFIGWHLFHYLKLVEDIEIIPFEREYFSSEIKMDEFVSQCETIVHLAALNRHESDQVLYDTNVNLVEMVLAACKRIKSTPHVLLSSSSQEEKDNMYGKSKRKGRVLIENWAKECKGKATGLVIPNVYGPFGKPNYNSVVATFCYKLNNDEIPEIHVDGQINLIYVQDLVESILAIISGQKEVKRIDGVAKYVVPHTDTIKVSELLTTLQGFKITYEENLSFPNLQNPFIRNLFNTYRSYISPDFFPHPHKLNVDNRGMFVEYARTDTSGQSSFSTTVPGITRGNHYHTRKVERFTVIKGKALIQLRKIGTTEVINYELDGSTPSFVDMPVWMTHNIKNIGEEELITLFWIDEPYDPENPDTYWEVV